MSAPPLVTPSRSRTDSLVLLLILASVTGGLVWLSISVAQERYRNILISAVLAQVLWVAVRWRMSLYVFMVFVAVEGFLINYFHTVPELNLLKDIFVGALFVVLAAKLVSQGIFPIPRTAWMVPFMAFAVIYTLQIFNPNLPNLLVGLVGVRSTLLYFLLMPVAYWFFDSRERLHRFFIFMLWLSVPVSLFGIFQYFVGPAWMLSLSPGFQRAVYYAWTQGPTESAYFRTFSTFVHTGGFGQYLMLLLLICVALWSTPEFRKSRRWMAAIFLLTFCALLTTGSRGALVWFLVAAGLLIITQRGATRTAPLLVAAPLVLWGSLFVVGPGFLDRFGTLLDLEYVKNRNMPLIYGWLKDSMQTEWTGYGAGYASVAARHVGVTPLNVGAVENGLAKIRYEAGLPGFLLYVAFVVALLLESLRAPARIRDPGVRWIASACGAFLFVNLLNVSMGTPFDTSPGNTYIWFFAGLLAKAGQISNAPPRPSS